MCAYSFPEHIPLSDSVKDIIGKILTLDPTKRLTLDEIMSHQFLNHGNNIPRYLPLSTLACPPSGNYLKQYINNNTDQYGSRVTSTTGKQGPNQNFTKNGTLDPQSSSQKRLPTNIQAINQKNQTNTVTNTNIKVQKDQQEVYVKKWVDYSTKYGLGYLLSNGSSGVFFNDCTKLILDPTKEYFEYIERRASDKVDVVSSYS